MNRVAPGGPAGHDPVKIGGQTWGSKEGSKAGQLETAGRRLSEPDSLPTQSGHKGAASGRSKTVTTAVTQQGGGPGRGGAKGPGKEPCGRGSGPGSAGVQTRRDGAERIGARRGRTRWRGGAGRNG